MVADVKQFEATHISDRQMHVGTLSDRDVYGHQRAKMTEAAREQLRPLAGAGTPLVVVLANPLGADVAMDFHHVAHAILGNLKFTISVGPNAPPDDPGEYVAEDYGAFRSVTNSGPVNHHSHVSPVVVVDERRHETDWIEQRLR